MGGECSTSGNSKTYVQHAGRNMLLERSINIDCGEVAMVRRGSGFVRGAVAPADD
jgi:hypothetical protein